MNISSASANADPAELDRFAASAHQWWNPDSPLYGPLHRMNPLRLAFIEENCGSLDGKQVLDVGCGGGILAEAMAARGAQVLGIDLAEASLEIAALHRFESGIDVEYRAVAVETLAAETPACYDIVTCLEMIEHVPDPGAVIKACAALTRPGGFVVLSTLDRTPLSYAMAILGAEYVLRLLPRGTHDWARFVRPAELAAWARQAGLMAIRFQGLDYQPFTKRFSTSRDIRANYLAAFRKTVS